MLLTPEKSTDMSGETNSMSKATICCFKISRCFRRNSCPSAGEDFDDISELALWRDVFVRWTIWWARSSKTVDYME